MVQQAVIDPVRCDASVCSSRSGGSYGFLVHGEPCWVPAPSAVWFWQCTAASAQYWCVETGGLPNAVQNHCMASHSVVALTFLV
jgi:hypothetical protein